MYRRLRYSSPLLAELCGNEKDSSRVTARLRTMPHPPGAIEPSLAHERRERLLTTLARDQRILSLRIARDLGVSDDTIRRDLEQLEREGLLRRVHGGALPIPFSPALGSYSERSQRDAQLKRRLGEAGATLLQSDMTVMLYGGTTILQVARSLAAETPLTLVTNDPQVALEIGRSPRRAECILIGGRFSPRHALTLGAVAVEAIQSMRFDLVLLGTCAIDAAFGIASADQEDAYLQRAAIASSARAVALVTPEKLGTCAPFRIAPVAALEKIVTVTEAPAATTASLREAGVLIELV
jgi:DeoR/GlpR family transcriptional regulator of sugar metabolism